MAERGPRVLKKISNKLSSSLLRKCHVNSLHLSVCGCFSKFHIVLDIYAQYIYLVVGVKQVFRAKRRRNRR